jgi:hypothetical protein
LAQQPANTLKDWHSANGLSFALFLGYQPRSVKMIGSNLPALHYVDALRKSLESGTVTAGKIQVANATAETQARIDESFRDTERNLERLTASFKSAPGRSTFEAKSNSVEQSNVPTDLQPLIETGRLEEKNLNDNGDLSIVGAAVYQEWLLARASVDISV